MPDTTEKTIADELREAVARLRETAKDAPSGSWGVNGPWWWDRGDQPANATSCIVTEPGNEPVAVLAPPYNPHPAAEKAGPWIRLVNPLLAEPLASWLEQAAEEFDREVITDTPECPNCGEGCVGHDDALVHDDGCGNWLADADVPGLRCECFDRPLAVARVLNGTSNGSGS